MVRPPLKPAPRESRENRRVSSDLFYRLKVVPVRFATRFEDRREYIPLLFPLSFKVRSQHGEPRAGSQTKRSSFG